MTWHKDAACRNFDPELMYPRPSDYAAVRVAKDLCEVCPVQAECLADALAEEGLVGKDQRFGIRGGHTPHARWAMRPRPRPAVVTEATSAADDTMALDAAADTLEDPVPRQHTGGRKLSPCGTRGAYDRHKRRGEPIDPECQAGHEERLKERSAAKRAALDAQGPRRELRPCGTAAAYERHIRRGEAPCEPCKEGMRESRRESSARYRARMAAASDAA